MTEAEWADSSSPEDMVHFVADRLVGRKARLFTLACLRRVVPYLRDERSHAALRTLDDFAEGAASWEELRVAAGEAAAASEGIQADASEQRRFYLERSAAVAVWYACGELNPLALLGALAHSREARRLAEEDPVMVTQQRERRAHAAFLRDVLGNPFHPRAVNPTWLDWNGRTVAALAQAAYEERQVPEGHLDPAHLAVLADALEDAGCADADILGHLRSPGPHVRGCWVVDLLLGKQ